MTAEQCTDLIQSPNVTSTIDNVVSRRKFVFKWHASHIDFLDSHNVALEYAPQKHETNSGFVAFAVSVIIFCQTEHRSSYKTFGLRGNNAGWNRDREQSRIY